MADDFDQIDRELHQLATGLLEDGVKPDDICGPMMSQSIAMLIAANGPKATAKHLRDLARRIDNGGSIVRH